MKTYEEQKAFYDAQWPAMRDALKEGGAEGLVAHILAMPDLLHRRILFAFVRSGLREDMALAGGLDGLVTVAHGAITEFLAQAEAATEEPLRLGRLSAANVVSYNLAADLHERPGETEVRTAQHHMWGLRAARDCLEWREVLGKPARAFSTAWWVRGVHELGLGKHGDAVSSFEQAQRFGSRAAEEAGRSAEVSPAGGYFTLFASGWRGIALMQGGDERGQGIYDEAIAAFTAQLDDAETREDAEYGLLQLRDGYDRRAT